MYDIERQEKILEILRREKSCSVAELAKLLCFSEATIRRDLNALDKEMKVRKTFGGAIIMERYSAEVPIGVRRSQNAAAKERICRAAARLLQDNMTVFLDASNTGEYILPYLERYSGLTVVTNNPDVPTMLSGTDITVYSTGGKYLHHSNAYVGEYARNTLRGINADLLFFSVRGLSLDGKLTTSSTEEDVHNVMIENAAKTCLLVDITKIGKTFPFTVCRLQDIDVVVTDKPLPNDLNHPNVILADK